MNPGDKVFHDWYAKGGPGSGWGSRPQNTAGYREVLQKFLKDLNIHSVLDFGCGDWETSRLIDWGNIEYHGVDIVPALIDRLNAEHGSPTRKFYLVDADAPVFPVDQVDLVISKDVLQHMQTAAIVPLLPRFGAMARHVFLTNDWSPNDENNQDTHRGGYQRLDFRRSPYNLPAWPAYRFEHGEDKRMFWWDTGRP